MRTVWPWLVEVEGDGRQRPDVDLDERSVLLVGGLLFAAQATLRLWMLLPSWFYTDDYRLLSMAHGEDLSWSYLREPFDSQFMPIGRAIAWVVANSGSTTANWTAAVLATTAMSCLASLACLWMLVVVFGARWQILPLYALYLFSALSAPALMWWAAGLNQLPLQAVWCVAVATWVHYLRSRSFLWLGLTLLALVVGLLCYVKALLILPILAFIAVGYFTTGSPAQRLRELSRVYWPAISALGVAAGVYLLYYSTAVPQPFIEAKTDGLAGDLADSMLGTTFATSALGGPWLWDNRNPPTGYADPPLWSVHVAWILLLLLILLSVLLRHRAARAWLVLALSLLMAWGLLLVTRAPVAGPAIGYEMRYLTETICALVLATGLAWLPVEGAREASSPRAHPLIRFRPTPALVGLMAIVYVVGAVTSAATYARTWHSDNPGDKYLHAVANTANGRGGLELADGIVPNEVMPGFLFPFNTLSTLLPLFTDNVSFPDAAANLSVVNPDGNVVPAQLDVKVASKTGPVAGCGWKVTSGVTEVRLAGETFDFDWWLKVDYLASQQSPVTVTTADSSVVTRVIPGLGTLYARASGSFDSIEFSGLTPGTTLCIDAVSVGSIRQEGS